MKAAEHDNIPRLEELSRDECLKFLGYSAFVGRVGFMHEGRPMILPVNYLFDDTSIIFRTAAETTLSTLDGAKVAFEVDNNRPLETAGWSVVVQGVVHHITDVNELEMLKRGPLHSWAWQSADQWFRISVETISGRQIPEN